MNKIAIFIAIILIAFSCQRVGSYVRDSFASNDIRIDRAWKTVLAEYHQMSTLKKEEVDIFPIAIYKQLVNGLNYKVFFGSVNKISNELQLFDYVLYTGPLTQSPDPFFFQLTSSKELVDHPDIALRKYEYEQIKKIISFQVEYDKESLVNLSVSRTYINVLGTASIYVVTAEKENQELPENYLIFQDENGKLEMIANWVEK